MDDKYSKTSPWADAELIKIGSNRYSYLARGGKIEVVHLPGGKAVNVPALERMAEQAGLDVYWPQYIRDVL